MAKRRPWRGVPWESRGFALIIVLWAFVLISLIVTHLTASGRTELRIAGNLAANAAAQAAADGAIYRAIFNVLDPRQDEHWDLDGGTHELQIADSRVTLRLENEAARINPNLASTPILQALLDVVTGNQEQAASVAMTIAEWVGAKKGSQPLTGINADYEAAGLNYGPPHEPFESIDELARVRGMTPDLFVLLRPHLTMFGPAIPDADSADPVVTLALAQAARISPGLVPPRTTGGADRVLTARINSTARGPGNAVANRVAIARIGLAVPRGYAMLAWESNAE